MAGAGVGSARRMSLMESSSAIARAARIARRARVGMVVLCQVDVLYLIVECDRFRPTRDVFRPEFQSRRGSRHAKIQGQLDVRALNDRFAALKSVTAMSQCGRAKPMATAAPANESPPPEAGGQRSDHFALARL